MRDKIKMGTLLIEEGLPLPNFLLIESEPYSNGWRLVKNFAGPRLERNLRNTGWNFSYMAVEIKTSVFGFDVEQSLRRAVNRALARLKSEEFNSLEITKVVSKRFLGLRHVTVFSHPRHIQEGVFLVHDKRSSKRGQAKLAAV
jgi:hypothetical protein